MNKQGNLLTACSFINPFGSSTQNVGIISFEGLKTFECLRIHLIWTSLNYYKLDENIVYIAMLVLSFQTKFTDEIF